MSLQDPISDMLTCIRNGQYAKKIFVNVPYSKVKESISKVLKKEGYIKNYIILKEKTLKLKVFLKYFQGKPVIDKIIRVSKPSLRQYKKCVFLPKILGGLGIAIVSTSRGMMTDHYARKIGIGGEIICYVE